MDLEEVRMLFSTFKKECTENGFEDRIAGVAERLTDMALSNQPEDAKKLLHSERAKMWTEYVEAIVCSTDQLIRPKVLFEKNIHDSMNALKQRLSVLRENADSTDSFDGFRRIVEDCKSLCESVMLSKRRSALGIIYRILVIGMASSFGSLAIAFQFIDPTVAVVPIPFGAVVTIAIASYCLIMYYPNAIGSAMRRGGMYSLSFVLVLLYAGALLYYQSAPQMGPAVVVLNLLTMLVTVGLSILLGQVLEKKPTT